MKRTVKHFIKYNWTACREKFEAFLEGVEGFQQKVKPGTLMRYDGLDELRHRGFLAAQHGDLMKSKEEPWFDPTLLEDKAYWSGMLDD